jgi:phosphonate transport system ATP-binding protein
MDRTLDGKALIPQRPTGADCLPVLMVVGLSKSFGERLAVSNVSFELSKHELVAVLGPSGAGKTTLFRCVTGIQKFDAGYIAFDGIGIEQLQLEDRRLIAVVFQQFNLVRRLTALDNVLAGRLGYVPIWRGLMRRFERADTLKAFESLERVGMLEHALQRADTLSGGQQQRVAIARALAQEPRLIVADEPVASLDPNAAAGILQLLKDIARTDGVSVICSLHQVDYARAYADRIIGLAHGRIAVDAATPALGDADYAAIYDPGGRRQTAEVAPADDARWRAAPAAGDRANLAPRTA